MDEFLVELLESFGHRAALAGSDGATIDGADRCDPSKRAGHKRFVGAVNIGETEQSLLCGDAVFVADLEHIATSDSTEAVSSVGGPDLAPFHDEEVGGVARRDESLRVEHESLVGAGFGGLNTSQDAVELGMAVELRVLHVGRTAPHVHREEIDASGEGLGLG